MNFRTTIVLLALLVAVGIAVFFVNRKGDDAETASADKKKLVDLKAEDVTRVVITRAGDPQRIVLERPAKDPSKKDDSPFGAPAGREWRLREPVSAAAQSWTVDGLVRDLTALETRSQLEAAKKSSVGLDQPQYKVELSGNGKSVQIDVGNKSAVGDNLYVQVAGRDKIDVVGPANVHDALDKSAGEYRSKKVVDVAQADIKQVTIQQPDEPQLRLEKAADAKWQVAAPTTMPGDATQVLNILSDITAINAEEFVAEKPGSATSTPAFYGFTTPQLTVSFSTQAPTTQPTTAPTTGPTTLPSATVLTFGRHENILKKNVFLSVTPPGGGKPLVAKVPATSLESFRKQPLDLRDRNAADIKPDDVSEFTLVTEKASTTQPAEQKTLHVVRRKENLELGPTLSPAAGPATAPSAGPSTNPTTAPAGAKGAEGPPGTAGATGQPAPATGPAAPATQPATQPSAAAPATQPAAPSTTQPATTQPSTAPATQPAAPAEEPSAWIIQSHGGVGADDGQVNDLLNALHPLRASKYLAQPPAATQPATQPSTATTYVLTVKTVAAGGATASHEFRITDPGGTGTPTVQYRNLVFEVDRTLLRNLEGDFKTPRPDPMPTPPPFGGPGGFPGPGGLPPGHP